MLAGHTVEEVAMARTDPGLPLEGSTRALLLDGDRAALSRLERSLQDRRVVTAAATDGTAGVERLLEELLSLDVVVVDLDLPHRDARALARLIRTAGNERDLALVVVADAPPPSLQAELRALGVDAIADRRRGPEAVAAAALEAVRARREAAAIELEAWRREPAPAPVGETTWPMWCAEPAVA
ncbi:MAG TPA: histidine kinase [Anaeromyxobacteraceae bacterium]|nr:histidine kinase [Anaeromyxobacteraceae bacterium]